MNRIIYDDDADRRTDEQTGKKGLVGWVAATSSLLIELLAAAAALPRLLHDHRRPPYRQVE